MIIIEKLFSFLLSIAAYQTNLALVKTSKFGNHLSQYIVSDLYEIELWRHNKSLTDKAAVK